METNRGNKMKCNHILETRDCYFPNEKKKGKITWCIKKDCNYVIKKMEK